MTQHRATGPEQAIDGFAATLFALCAGFSLSMLGVATLATLGGASLAGIVTFFVLQRIDPTTLPLRFDIVDHQFDEPVDDTLLLEDRLVEPEADSRVVRLFANGGAADGTLVPGELAARIDRFLDGPRGRKPGPAFQSDASQELYEALADIRRTLR